MRKKNNEDESCYAIIGSVTQSIQAQKLLAGAGIYTQIVKADSISPKYGCAYAIEYSCNVEESVKQILRKEGIHAKGAHRRV